MSTKNTRKCVAVKRLGKKGTTCIPMSSIIIILVVGIILSTSILWMLLMLTYPINIAQALFLAAIIYSGAIWIFEIVGALVIVYGIYLLLKIKDT